QSPAVRQRLIADYARGSSRARSREGARGTRRPAAPPKTPGIPGAVSAPASRPLNELGLTEVLTERELEVVTALADGLSNKQIAARLGLGENTVKWHIGNMLDKTGAADRTQLALWAFQRGLNP
ncbi:response regulator transcription factor, partial [Microbacterium sp. CPCC 204701]|uniref:response regulator transcription factor n=1 Tax=Microbacterium sp. CPCC 204701 TaxID=2493084 RepID=UPI0013E2DBCF